MTKTHTAEILKAAILGFESQKAAIDAKIAACKEMLEPGTATEPEAIETAPGKKRHMSEAGKANVRAALKKRWAAHHQRIEDAKAAEVKPKRKLSRAQKAAMIANAAKARAAAAKNRKAAAKGGKGHATKHTARKVVNIAA